MSKLFVWVIGFLSGIASAINSVASSGAKPSLNDLVIRLIIFSLIGGFLFIYLRRLFMLKIMVLVLQVSQPFCSGCD